jgi:hypothetical protein
MAVSRTRGREREEAPPKSDAYTGLVAISLGAMITGSVLLYLDWSQYPTKAPTLPPPPAKYQPQAGQAAPGPAAPAGTPAPAPGT